MIASLSTPTGRDGASPNAAMISSPVTGGWKLRTRSFSSITAIFSRTRRKLFRKRRTFSGFLLVMSASQSFIRLSTSSPASKSRRRTAESVTSSSARLIGRMWSSTIFCTNFIFSFIGNFIRRKMRGTMRSPTSSWL